MNKNRVLNNIMSCRSRPYIATHYEKMIRRYTTQMEALWRLVVETKYDSLRGAWCSKEVAGPFEVEVWKNIRIGWGVFLSFVRYEMG
jgi:hypothetical protein